MKKRLLACLIAVLAALAAGPTALWAGGFSANFNDNLLPPGTALYGSAYIGGGVLKLTDNINGQQGSFIINELDPGSEVNGVDAQFKVRVGGGTSVPADGFSFNFADDLRTDSFSEEGDGSGLIVAFDIYDNGGGEAPAVDVKWLGATVATTVVPIDTLRTGADFVDVHIRLDGDGSVDVTYDGQTIYENVFLPGYFTFYYPQTGFGARTGGLNENQWVDDIQITTTVGPALIGLTLEPADTIGLLGAGVGFYAEVTDPMAAVSYQWKRKRPGEASFSDIPGAADLIYRTPILTLADDGTQYMIEVVGLENTVQSAPATLTVVDLPLPPPDVTYDFDDGALPDGTAAYGSAYVDTYGGVGDSGVLVLTIAANDQNGSFIVGDLNAGSAIDGFAASFQAFVGNGMGAAADGFSFSFGNDIPDGVFTFGEEGAGTGLIVCFDTYNNSGGEAPAVDVKWQGATVASRKVPIQLLRTSDHYAGVLIRLETDGTVDVAYDGVVLHHNLNLPGFHALGNVRFALAGRTGGLNDDHLVDDLALSTELYAGGLEILDQPDDAFILPGQQAVFAVQVNDPAQASFRWQKKGPAEAAFSDIPGAVSAAYTTPAAVLADNGTLFRVVATGTFNIVTSDEAMLAVLDLARPTSPKIDFDFNDGLVPAGTAIYGNAFVDTYGGVGDSGVLKLTGAVNDQNGSFLIEDVDVGVAIETMTAAFDMRVGGGSAVPADGFSFSWADDLPNGITGEAENGAGTGLRVAFDIYDNGGGEAPAVDLFWNGAAVASLKVPIDALRTDDAFAEVLIRLNPDGTLDLVYDQRVLFYEQPLTGYNPAQPIAGGRFGFAARTGGLNENQWVDNIAIDTVLYSGPTAFVREPLDQYVIPGTSGLLSAAVSDPARTTFQWFVKGPADPAFQQIPGATAPTYITPPMAPAADGTEYRVRAQGPGGEALSRVATVNIVLGAQTVSYSFDDGLTPAGTAVFGTAYADTSGGVNNTGYLVLTLPANDQQGSFLIDDLASGETVKWIEVGFKLRVCCGTTPPADGFSFNFAPDLPNGAFGEEGTGSGLTIAFDTYDNGNLEAPAIDVKWGGVTLASTKVPIDLLLTPEVDLVDVLIRLRTDNSGVLDLVYDGEIVYYGLPIPAFDGLARARFGFDARTGGANAEHAIDDLSIALVAGFTPVEPTVSIVRDGDNVVVTFTGILQSTTDLKQAFTDVPGATSPYVTGIAPVMFYRVR